MIFLVATRAILALATFAYHVAALDECTIMALAVTKIKDIEADANVIIAQATEKEDFICEFPNGSSAALDLNQGQSNALRLMLGDGSVVSGKDKAIVETAIRRDEVKGKGGGEIRVKIAAGLSIQEAIKRESPPYNRRHMAQLMGNKYVLVVIGNGNDHAFNPSRYASFGNKAAAVSDDVFGSGSDTVNMA